MRPGHTSVVGPKRQFTATQRYVRSWNTTRHGADIVRVRLQHSSRVAFISAPVASWPPIASFPGQHDGRRRRGGSAPRRELGGLSLIFVCRLPEYPSDFPVRRGSMTAWR